MDDAPTPDKIISKSELIKIEQENKIYELKIEYEESILKFKIINSDPFIGTYSCTYTLKDIKSLHQVFSMLHSFQDFIDYIKALALNKKIEIKPYDDKISIIINAEYLLKQNVIEINLTQEELNYKLITKELRNEIFLLKKKFDDIELSHNSMKEENEFFKNKIKILENNDINNENNINILYKEVDELKQENFKLKEELNKCNAYIKEIKINNKEKTEINNDKDKINTININSSIMSDMEFELIKGAIKERINNKEIKDIKKLYQATKDGEDASFFHKKCDNIPNTLILIKSAGNRCFGGFTSECWESSIKCKNDKNAFLFSLDKKKIYPSKNDTYSICCSTVNGPCFGYGNTIKIGKNPLKEKALRTFESNPECSYIFNGDNNALSEDGKYEGIYAKDYEVFQIIFS